jgi:hypothetical protein
MKTTKTQIIWDYIRRNPVFRVGDIVMITGVKLYTLTIYLSEWEKDGVIELIDNVRPVTERTYKMTKKSIKPPVLKNSKTKNKEKAMIKDLQTKEEIIKIEATHARVKPTKQIAETKTKKITLQSRLIQGRKGIGYSPTVYRIDDVGNIVCKDTGFIVDKMEIKAGESYGYCA